MNLKYVFVLIMLAISCDNNLSPDNIHHQSWKYPVVEKNLGDAKFIANDLLLDDEDHRFVLVFGPNMSGKSTYMRQTALMMVMAQIGSFVPAGYMRYSLIDKIFTRVGAMDDLFSGQSTFMLEMTETANILDHATKNSLIILDEIGRGTSTYDGMSIAWAVSEYILMKIGAKTLFATHYHELAQLEAQYQGIKNYNVAINEEGEDITFLHKVVPGVADRSYGVHVAKLAGLPGEVIGRANEILTGLEDAGTNSKGSQQMSLL